jgi:hypothetical protein
MRSMRTLTDQVANLLKGGNTQAPPVYHELGAQTSGMVCSNCGMPGHTNQLCHQQKQQSQPYRPPQVRTNLGNLKPRYAYHELCRGRYALGQCWVENNVRCSNCGDFHPNDRCRTPDKVIPLQPPLGNYQQQAQDNLQNARNKDPGPSTGPPNLYYDHQNNRQTHNSHVGLQTAQGVIPLSSSPSTHDARYIGSLPPPVQGESSMTHHVNMVEITNIDEHSGPKDLPALVITRGGARTSLDDIQEEEEVVSEEDSEGSPHFSELNDTFKDTAKEVGFGNDPSVEVEPDEDEYQFVTNDPLYRPPMSRERTRFSKVNNPSSPSDLWEDLARTKANISFGQLIQLEPSLQKQMKEGATMHRQRHSMEHVHQVVEVEDLKDSKEAFGNIIIDVEIVDKVIPNVIVDEGSSVNIMPLTTMEKLSLSITNPPAFLIKCADQSTSKTLGRIRNLPIHIGGEEYKVTFEVVRMKAHDGTYPLLLGCGFLRQCGGATNWVAKKPTFTYSPKSNRTTINIPARGLEYDGDLPFKTVKPTQAIRA